MAELDADFYRSLKSKELHNNANKREGVVQGRYGAGALYPKKADVLVYQDANGVDWVAGVNGGNPVGVNPAADLGISISKAVGNFGWAGWCYLRLPKGITIPHGLDVVHTPVDGGDQQHHSIRCLNPMRLADFKGLVDTLARAAVEKSVTDGVPCLIQKAPAENGNAVNQ